MRTQTLHVQGDSGQQRLLILQNNELSSRALQRSLASFFDTITLLSTEAEARRALLLTDFTHLICGLHFGEQRGVGAAVARRLKAEHECLQRVYVATTDRSCPTQLDGIDGVLFKPCAVGELSRLFAAKQQRAAVAN